MSRQELLDLCMKAAEVLGWREVCDRLVQWADKAMYGEMGKDFFDGIAPFIESGRV